MENKKNLFIGIGIVILVVGLFIATMFVGGENDNASDGQFDANVIIANAQKESEAITESQMKELEKINITQYLDYYNDTELHIVFIARPTCPYCEITEPIIRKIAKDYNLNISYLNTDEFTDEDKTTFVKHNEAFNEGYGTPLTLLVSNGQINGALEGLTDTDHFLEFFKAYNLI